MLPAGRIDEFLQAAAVAGFEVLPQPKGRWPKVRHKDTDVTVDILPEGGRPGTAAKPAPTTVPHPLQLGGSRGVLHYVRLPSLIELKLAAGRVRDEGDVIELIRANGDQIEEIRRHLTRTHAEYANAFDALVAQAREQEDH